MPLPQSETDDADDTTPDAGQGASSEPAPQSELVPVPPPPAPIRRGAKQAFEEVEKFRAEFSSFREESKKERETERQTWEQERTRLTDEIRRAQDVADRAAQQSRPRQDDDGASDKDYDAAIKELRDRKWKAAQKDDSVGFDEAEEGIQELKAERLRRQIAADFDKKIADSRPPEDPPEVAELKHEYRDLMVKRGGWDTAVAFDKALAAQGEAPSQARFRKAFDQAAIYLGVREPKTTENRPSKEQRARSLPSGGSGAGNGGGGGKAQGLMPPNWRDIAKRNDMSEDEYTRIWLSKHPEHIQEP